MFEQSNITVTAYESYSENTNLAVFEASDKDSGNNGEVVYSIEDDFGFLKINPKTGVISTVNDLEGYGREGPYTVTVKASDKGKATLSSLATLSLFIKKADSESKEIVIKAPESGFNLNILEDTLIDSEVFVLQATIDGDSNDDIRYYIEVIKK